jgi:murein L,D-transpeptidase YcbB/YkuD
MTGRRNQGNRDVDDWFVEPEPSPRQPRRTAAGADAAETHESAPTVADDWLAGESTAERAPRFRSRLAAVDNVWLAVAALALLLLVGLAAAGVFSSANHKAPPTTVSTTPTTPSTTTQATTTHTFATLPTSNLKPGDTGAQVTSLQRALTALGYSTGTADGDYGPATQRAVARFQQASGLTADGIFGPKTLMALNRAAGP